VKIINVCIRGKFLHSTKTTGKNPYETRAFAYRDIISWIENKGYNKSMGTAIHEKYLQGKRRK
jgi:effector-binding domain-containing protein